MLGELYWYFHQEPPPADAKTTEEMFKYLKACHNLFECEFLAHDNLASLDSPVFSNIDQGFQYFTAWLTTLLTKGTMHNLLLQTVNISKSCRSKFSYIHQHNFLSWQSECIVSSIYIYIYIVYSLLSIAWNLLTIKIYGFRAICENFTKYPGYFISLLRNCGKPL